MRAILLCILLSASSAFASAFTFPCKFNCNPPPPPPLNCGDRCDPNKRPLCAPTAVSYCQATVTLTGCPNNQFQGWFCSPPCDTFTGKPPITTCPAYGVPFKGSLPVLACPGGVQVAWNCPDSRVCNRCTSTFGGPTCSGQAASGLFKAGIRICSPEEKNNSCPNGVAQAWDCGTPAPVGGSMVPHFMVTQVYYAVPGHQSFMTYSNGIQVGSALSVSTTSGQGVTASISAGINIPTIAKSDATYSFGQAWGDTSTNETDVTVSYSVSEKISAQEDAINHDDDLVVFIASPHFNVSFNPQPPGYWSSPVKTFTLVDDPQTESSYLTVGELLGHVPLDKGTITFLANHGITAADMAQMLKADPFAGAADGADVTVNPARFDFVGAYPFRPLAQGETSPDTTTITFDRKETQSTTTGTTVTITSDVKVDAGADFLALASIQFGVDYKWTYTHSTSAKDFTSTDSTQTLNLGRPLFPYNGPVELRVWVDRIYHTFMFTVDNN